MALNIFLPFRRGALEWGGSGTRAGGWRRLVSGGKTFCSAEKSSTRQSPSRPGACAV